MSEGHQQPQPHTLLSQAGFRLEFKSNRGKRQDRLERVGGGVRKCYFGFVEGMATPYGPFSPVRKVLTTPVGEILEIVLFVLFAT
jgi:hypothetical protein